VSLPDLPPHAALLLDMDGTLIDLAATPDAVVVPPGLIATLHRLRGLLGDALAIVSGRPIAQVEALLGDAPYAVAGEHGGAIRHAPRAPPQRAPLPHLPPAALAAAEAAIAAHPGALLERKAHGLVLHYRQAPAAAAALRTTAEAIATAGFTVMASSMAWEVKPAGIDKGSAVTALMARPPFQGRIPVFIGDDVTDEDGIRAAQALGGLGLRVPEVFGGPAGVRAWLEKQAALF
jgi:trehalose 6-phosphate phosphatase